MTGKTRKQQPRGRRVPDETFVRRLDEIAAPFGSRAALARVAGLIPGSVQSYAEGSEPTRKVLVALARAGRVSVDWLASGQGPGPGQVAIPFFDLRTYKMPPQAPGKLDVFTGFEPADASGVIMLQRRSLERQGVIGEKESESFFFAVEALDGSNSPVIDEGDILVVHRELLAVGTVCLLYRAGRFAVRRVEMPFVRREPGLVLRPLNPSFPPEEAPEPSAGAEGKAKQQVASDELRILGRVVWVGGRL